MPKLFNKTNGTWKEILRPLVKDGGVWRPIRKIYVKNNGVWQDVFGNSASLTFSQVGNFSFTVPAGVYNVTSVYPTVSGNITNTQSVTPGQTLTGSIRDFGYGSSFNGIDTPAYNIQIFSFSGNVDHLDYFTLKCGSTTAQSYTGTGTGPTHTSACAAKGITLTESSEIYHGDLVSTITVNTVPNSTLVNRTQIYGTYNSGRYQYGLIQNQPNASNNYTAKWGPYDPGGGEGFYNYTITLQQIVPFFITY